MRICRQYFLGLGWAIILSSCGIDKPEAVRLAGEALPEKIDYNLHVKPILSDRCFACHGPDEAKQKAYLRLDREKDARRELVQSPGKFAIVPGKPARSELVHRILQEDPEKRMPPPESNLSLTPYEKALLIRWVNEGAEYQPHWAFIPTSEPPVPDAEPATSDLPPIDRFVRARLRREGLKPSALADKETLLRRVTFDLTGLPPTLGEINAFLADRSPEAYEKVIDRLLASPTYGEHMAAAWLDLARYADTHGYTVDRFRDMSPWRDWVIEAFNRNMPFDQFVTWQLAGDLLPKPSREQLLATGFNRLHPQNMEGGIVDEEFRVAYVVDRTNTLGTAFLGLTVSCAQCHDHKYDPISQKEYYQLFSYFNNVQEAGQISWDNAMPVPTMLLPNEELEEVIDFIDRRIRKQEREVARIAEAKRPAFEKWWKGAPRLPDRPFPIGLTAHFPLDKASLADRLHPTVQGRMKTSTTGEDPQWVAGKQGLGLLLNGDAWLDLGPTGVFSRAEPFSVGIWVNIPRDIQNGVIFHKSSGAALYNYRGYHLALSEERLELLMAHTTPYNAIVEYAHTPLPRDEWVHLLMTYDGSSRAAGLRLYLNGKEVPTEVETDHLYKDILFQSEPEPGLQVGARWRGIGLKGGKVDEITVFDRMLSSVEAARLAGLRTGKESMSADEAKKDALWSYYLDHHVPAFRAAKEKLTALRAEKNEKVESVPEVMIMDEMDSPRQAFVLERGQYNARADSVFPGTPAAILPIPDSLPNNRLGLARWLFLPDHPLTARVAVNRIWQSFFGQGLVKTTEDFGNQGDLPSHPQLLDWLAHTFRTSGWDVKALQKQIVLSATYRQASVADAALREKDPQNKWLARGPATRLTAEMLRDQALAASGLLVTDIGGPSVKPYQPEGLWRVNGGKYVEDRDKGLYRRSLYTFWKRSVPNTTLQTFDVPDRSNCTVRRQRTTTPLQSLILLNDPTFVEAARALGARMAAGPHPREGVEQAFRKLTGRHPASGETAVLMDLYTSEWEKFKRAPEKTAGWLQEGAFRAPEGTDPARLAACTVVASTILNADASVVKR